MRLTVYLLVVVTCILTLSLNAFSETAGANNISVTVIDMKNSNGQVVVNLFNNKKGFPDLEFAWKRLAAEINDGKACVVLKDIPKGEYAISAYHDENKNNTLDTNFIGIPKEGVAMSNNPKSRFGPPGYEKTKFNFEDSHMDITINLKYLFGGKKND